MKKLVRLIEDISDEYTDVIFEFNTQGLGGTCWSAKVTVNHTALFKKKDFDRIETIPAIEERYVMEEVSLYPHRAIENITHRLNKAYKNMEKGEE